MRKWVSFYEKHYPVVAAAIAASLLTAIVAFSPIGDKIEGKIAGLAEPDEATGAGFFARVANDWGVRPNRFLHIDGTDDVSKFKPVEGRFADRRAAQPLLYSRDAQRDGAIVIVGAFEFPEGLHGAILINRKGDILHRWPIPPHAGRDGFLREDYRTFPHGFSLDRDGSAVIAFDGGGRILRIDACGRQIWRRNGAYHHAVTADPERPGEVWTWHFESASRLRAVDGESLESVRIPLIRKANPELDILGVRERDEFDKSTPYSDAIHLNDADPLPAALAPKFPQFNAGDLLISARSLNLVFVVDRETLKVKWHASGYWRRQHDPDWGSDGRIYVYDNNMNRGFTSIVAIDPKTMKTETVIDGEKYGLYSNIRGKQSWSPDGRVFLVSPMQGRALEIDDKGEVAFEFLNRYDEKTKQSLVLSEAFEVPDGYFTPGALDGCAP